MASHPMWVRGLKQRYDLLEAHLDKVAPYVGAWIETLLELVCITWLPVAPYVGAWIETIMICFIVMYRQVAPYVGAWIETLLPA